MILEDPLGMRSRRVRGTTAHELLVLPLIAPVEATDSGGGRGDAAQSGLDPAGAGSRLDVAGVEFEIDGLRPYRDGSPATRIHWPTVARSGEMFERRLVAGAVGAPLVVLDAGRPDDEESLEHAVRAAASLCVHLGRRRGCAALIPGAARPVELGRDLAGWPHLHASLALVGAGDAPGGSLRSLRAQTVFWVSAASASAAERDSRRIGARRRWLVTPTGLNGIGVAFTVAGCRGQLLSAAMPRASRRRKGCMSDLGAWRLIAFAALAAFATLHWFTLLADPPLARAILLVAIVVAGSALLLAIGASSLAGRRTRSAVVALWCLSGLVALLTLAAGLLAAGLPLRLLPPWQWGELGARLDPALGRLDELGVPYTGDATWVRRAILFGAPVLLTLAAALAFWPARRARTRSALRLAGLIALLALFGIAVAWDSRGAELPLGLALLGLIAAWLWLPRLATRRSAAIGFATVGLAAAMALPASAALDGDRAWWDYRAWNLLSDGAPTSFRWEHSYGPLDWPRDGTTLLRVRSDEARYWKAEVLDSFDGRRWQRAPLEESPAQSAFARYGQADAETHPGWLESADFEIGELRSELVFAPGTAERTSINLSPSADGTTTTGADPLTSGDVYTVEAYVPDPTQAQLRGADRSYSPELAPYTSLELPLEESGAGGETTVSVPPWGSGLAEAAQPSG